MFVVIQKCFHKIRHFKRVRIPSEASVRIHLSVRQYAYNMRMAEGFFMKFGMDVMQFQATLNLCYLIPCNRQ